MNTLFIKNNQPYGAYPFSLIKEEDFKEAFLEAIEKKRKEIEQIINNTDTPTFENTILALENAGKELEWVSGVFFNILHSNSNDYLMGISEEIVPILSSLSTEITLNTQLFNRINAVYNNRESFNLDEEDSRLLQNCYDGFFDSGATLPDEKKNKIRELSQKMSNLCLTFSNNLLKEQNMFKLHITEKDKVQDMPESCLRLASQKALEEGYSSGWIFDLSAPSYFPFLQYCSDRELRKLMYLKKAFLGANDNEFDNRQIVKDLANGRLEEANILGFKDFASFTLKHRMAKKTENVYELLDVLLEGYKPKAEEELLQISSFAEKNGASTPLKIWDWSYWAEKYKKFHFEIDSEILRPYFELSSVTKSVFNLATNLYGIKFKERFDIDVYNKDVKVFEVTDEDNSFLGLLYTDFFPRKGKQSGAWMSTFQDQYLDKNGVDHRPHVVLVMNFTPPSNGIPSLLTLGEVSTLLHEFGHALHGILTKCKYSSMSGTAVARDFVELPSQLMENWLKETKWLKTIGRHYKTNESIPDDLVEKIKRAESFLVGYNGCRQLSFGYLDMAWHTIKEPLSDNLSIFDFENKAWDKALVIPTNRDHKCIMSTSFSHIFSGGYSAGYYGYKWAEVLDADAFELFISGGLYNKSIAKRFRNTILANGDKKDAMDLYIDFRGQKPNPHALLRRDGIIK